MSHIVKRKIYNYNNMLTGITWPMLTVSTCSGFTPADESAALAATVCKSVADTVLNAPPKVPKAVRLAPTMKIPIKVRFIFK